MGFFTTALIVGAAAVGTAATVHTQRKNAKKQTRAIEKQEEKARTVAKEQAALDAARDSSGAEVKLGREDEATVGSGTTAGTSAGRTRRKGSLAGRVGGLAGNTLADAWKKGRRIGI